MFKHTHRPLRGCVECDKIYEMGKLYQSGINQMKQQHPVQAMDYLREQYNTSLEELRKARLKIDVYERMFSALRIPVLPKEGA